MIASHLILTATGSLTHNIYTMKKIYSLYGSLIYLLFQEKQLEPAYEV